MAWYNLSYHAASQTSFGINLIENDDNTISNVKQWCYKEYVYFAITKQTAQLKISQCSQNEHTIINKP